MAPSGDNLQEGTQVRATQGRASPQGRGHPRGQPQQKVLVTLGSCKEDTGADPPMRGMARGNVALNEGRVPLGELASAAQGLRGRVCQVSGGGTKSPPAPAPA